MPKFAHISNIHGYIHLFGHLPHFSSILSLRRHFRSFLLLVSRPHLRFILFCFFRLYFPSSAFSSFSFSLSFSPSPSIPFSPPLLSPSHPRSPFLSTLTPLSFKVWFISLFHLAIPFYADLMTFIII